MIGSVRGQTRKFTNIPKKGGDVLEPSIFGIKEFTVLRSRKGTCLNQPPKGGCTPKGHKFLVPCWGLKLSRVQFLTKKELRKIL